MAHAKSRLAHVACIRFNSYSARWAKSKKGDGVKDGGLDPGRDLRRKHWEAESPALPGAEERLEQCMTTG